MKRNISEELKINDDITLDTGEDNKPEEEKEAEELRKEVQKDIDDKNNILDDIREGEAVKAEANSPEGKALKISQFVEKLILDETSDDVLNEDFNEFIFEKRSNAVSAVYRALESYVNALTSTNIDILDECESVCEEALIHLEDALDSDEILSGD